ncbi:phage head closure protein [Mesorhizobium sp. NBSH29]|uniref:phage head closure protein n=1 Tax=Mesorhizobium sp. NBSH29 TaxID=2654249 RepID=UPI00189676B0|nr:phage head closure protein [Mesorhizobium sp. NBSH29]QPC87213.1 phage head closure protein [Mesorhizobium sp. NBSH29]
MRLALLDPGMLRHQLSLEVMTPLADAHGGHTESWVEVAALFGMVEPVAADSIAGADQSLESVTHRITIRARPGLRSGMRFTRGTRAFVILTAHDPDETGRYLVCRTREEGL